MIQHDMGQHGMGMDAAQMMAGGSGTYFGHWGPGLGIFALALFWLWFDRGAVRRGADQPIQTGWLVPLAKIGISSFGLYMELPGRTWYPMDFMMGWQHMTVHAAIIGSGVVDILHMRGRLPARTTYMGIAVMLFAGTAIFLGHHNHDGMSDTAHFLLAVTFGVAGVLTLVEGWNPGLPVRSIRRIAVATVGVWLIVIAWIIFRSGWDPESPLSEGWVWTLYAWSWMGTAALFTGLDIVRSGGATGRSSDAEVAPADFEPAAR